MARSLMPDSNLLRPSLGGKRLQTLLFLLNTFRVLSGGVLFCGVLFSNAVNGSLLVGKEQIALIGTTSQIEIKPTEQVLTATYAAIPSVGDINYSSNVTRDGSTHDLGYHKFWLRTSVNNPTTSSIVRTFHTNKIVDGELTKPVARVVATYPNATITDDAVTGALANPNTLTMNKELTEPTRPVTRTPRHTLNSDNATSVTRVQMTMSDKVSPNVPEISVDEGDTEAYEIELAEVPTGNVTISGNTGIATVSGPLEFTTENWNQAQEVTVTGTQDRDFQNDSTRITHTIVGGGYDSVTVDDDSPGIEANPTTLMVDEGKTKTYNVTITAAPTGTVTITPVSGNTDIATVSGPLEFTTENWPEHQEVTVTGTPDGDFQDDSTRITHTIQGGGYDNVADQPVDVTVDDDDSPGIKVNPTTLTVDEEGTRTYSVKLAAAPPTSSVTVTPRSHDTSVATVSGTLTFTTDSWNNPQLVTVTGIPDDGFQDESTRITHTISGEGYGGATDQPVEVTVDDDDSPGIEVSRSVLTVDEGGTRTYSVKLIAAPTDSVTVTPASDDDSRATVSGAVRFTRNDWATPQNVRVSGTQDDDLDHEFAVITHTMAGGGYDDVPDRPVLVEVIDDDVPGIRVNPLELMVDEGKYCELHRESDYTAH